MFSFRINRHGYIGEAEPFKWKLGDSKMAARGRKQKVCFLK
jgi:hypothetical protein